MEEDEQDGKTAESHDVTKLLMEWNKGGEEDSPEKLFSAVYNHLRRLARRHLRGEKPGHMLQTTALVHEAYLKLIDQRNVSWQNRAHFFAIAAQAMRRILLDHARRNIAEKRGGAIHKISLDDLSDVPQMPDEKLIALNDALNELAQIDAHQSCIIELRYFGGLTVEETAEVLKVSPRTVQREWTIARAWLYQNLSNKNSI